MLLRVATSMRPCAGARPQEPARAIQPKYHLIWLQVQHLVNTTHFTAVVFCCTSVNIALTPSLCVRPRPSTRELQQVNLCSSLCGGGSAAGGWLAALVAPSHWKRSTKVSKSEVFRANYTRTNWESSSGGRHRREGRHSQGVARRPLDLLRWKKHDLHLMRLMAAAAAHWYVC